MLRTSIAAAAAAETESAGATNAAQPKLERNRAALIASVLAGSWRASPPPFDLSQEDLARSLPWLLGSGAGGLAWWRVRESPWRDSGPAQELHQAYRLHSLQAALHEREISQALSLLRSAGVEPILGKGWAMARLYPESGLRPYGDLDLYVRPEQHSRARQVIEAPDGRVVDLHRGFDGLDDRNPGEILRRSQLLEREGLAVRVFGVEDHLRLVCLHMLRHGVLRPLWLCDVAVALESRPASFDWAYFAAGRPRRTEWVACALALAHDLLGARLDGVPAAIATRRRPRWLARTVLREWGRGRPPHGARTPMAYFLGHPAEVSEALRALVLRWPNGIEATVGVGGRFNDLPRLPFQLAECVRRSVRWAGSLALSAERR